MFLVLLVCLGLAAAAWRFFEGKARWCIVGAIVVVHPLLALTGAKELLHLVAGHGAELAFATLCLWKALDGGFTESRLERALYGTVGWYLLGRNVILCFGLITSASSRAEYDQSGSFGFTNDYLRVAHEVLGWLLQTVAGAMLLLALASVPAALFLWRVSARAVREPEAG
jgi:hypothetical protein